MAVHPSLTPGCYPFSQALTLPQIHYENCTQKVANLKHRRHSCNQTIENEIPWPSCFGTIFWFETHLDRGPWLTVAFSVLSGSDSHQTLSAIENKTYKTTNINVLKNQTTSSPETGDSKGALWTFKQWLTLKCQCVIELLLFYYWRPNKGIFGIWFYSYLLTSWVQFHPTQSTSYSVMHSMHWGFRGEAPLARIGQH